MRQPKLHMCIAEMQLHIEAELYFLTTVHVIHSIADLIILKRHS